MRYLYSFILLFVTHTLFAQYNISGYVLDKKKEPLTFASIVLVEASDTTVVSFGLSNERGKYLIEVKDTGNYLLQYSFLGYATQFIPLKTNWKDRRIILKEVQMSKSDIKLGAVDINEERIPMKLIGDTIQYDAKAFKVPEGSDVEKLLRQMPGIEVDEDGNITAHGKQVEKILVDGKEFFGNDPKMATKNIDAKAVDKVEVLDKKSDEAEFTGVDDGEEQKTINLKLKEDFKNGSFGNAFLGVGTEETYKAKVNYNRFNKNTQMSAIANANNINETPFTFQEFQEFAGTNNLNNRLVNGIGGNEGINAAISSGINYNHEFNKKAELQAYYYLISNNKELDKTMDAENFIADSTYSTFQTIDEEEDQINHSLNAKLKWKPNSQTEINAWTNFFLAQEDYFNASNTLYSPSENSTHTLSTNDIGKLSNYNQITIRRKFDKARRNIRLNINHYQFTEDDETVIDNDVFGRSIHQNQLYVNEISRPRIQGSFTEPLDSFWTVTLGYQYQYESNRPQRDFYDISNGENIFNDALSSDFERITNENKGTITFRRSKFRKVFYSIGTSAIDVHLQASNIDRNFQFLTPFASARFRLKGSQIIGFRYNAKTKLPSLNQLISIPNNTNPNSRYIGNPNLRPEYSHNVTFNYFYFNPLRSMSVYCTSTLTYSFDNIVNQTIVNENLTTHVSPQNTDLRQQFNLFAGMSLPIKKLKVKAKIDPSAQFDSYEAFLNGISSEVSDINYGSKFSISKLKRENWNIELGIDLRTTDRQYEANSDFDQQFSNYGWFVLGDYDIKKQLVIEVDYRMTRYTGAFFDEEREVHLVNASIRQSIQDGKWAFSLIANDILNENIGISRSGSINGLIESSYNARAQYFMVAIERSLGKKPENAPNKSGRGRRGGRMMRR